MKTLTRPNQHTLTRADLLAGGFTAAQVDNLEALKAIYPYVEFLDSRKEIERLRFMKWMIHEKSAFLP